MWSAAVGTVVLCWRVHGERAERVDSWCVQGVESALSVVCFLTPRQHGANASAGVLDSVLSVRDVKLQEKKKEKKKFKTGDPVHFIPQVVF